MATVTLTEKDIDYISRVVETEVPRSMARRDPEQYEAMVKAVVDTIANRVASPSFPNTVKEVVEQNRQFSKIAGPKRLNPYKTIENTPKARASVQQLVKDHVHARAKGAPSVVGGSLHYANPNYSDEKNLGWINSLAGPTLGRGTSIHVHGTAPGYRPTEARIATPGVRQGLGSPMAAKGAVGLASAPAYADIGKSAPGTPQGLLAARMDQAAAREVAGRGIIGGYAGSPGLLSGAMNDTLEPAAPTPTARPASPKEIGAQYRDMAITRNPRDPGPVNGFGPMHAKGTGAPVEMGLVGPNRSPSALSPDEAAAKAAYEQYAQTRMAAQQPSPAPPAAAEVGLTPSPAVPDLPPAQAVATPAAQPVNSMPVSPPSAFPSARPSPPPGALPAASQPQQQAPSVHGVGMRAMEAVRSGAAPMGFVAQSVNDPSVTATPTAYGGYSVHNAQHGYTSYYSKDGTFMGQKFDDGQNKGILGSLFGSPESQKGPSMLDKAGAINAARGIAGRMAGAALGGYVGGPVGGLLGGLLGQRAAEPGGLLGKAAEAFSRATWDGKTSAYGSGFPSAPSAPTAAELASIGATGSPSTSLSDVSARARDAIEKGYGGLF